ncbi:MAG: hypothetical protein H6707_12140 [Deltaproteobacteria bacterium]|nr:hypothetical protein [Deltaproteobacteria bacterium]
MYRDESEALRARIAALEAELSAERAALEAAEARRRAAEAHLNHHRRLRGFSAERVDLMWWGRSWLVVCLSLILMMSLMMALRASDIATRRAYFRAVGYRPTPVLRYQALSLTENCPYFRDYYRVTQQLRLFRPELRRCVTDADGAETRLRVTVLPDGAIGSLSVLGELPPASARCVREKLKRVMTPPFQQSRPITVTVPLVSPSVGFRVH